MTGSFPEQIDPLADAIANGTTLPLTVANSGQTLEAGMTLDADGNPTPAGASACPRASSCPTVQDWNCRHPPRDPEVAIDSSQVHHPCAQSRTCHRRGDLGHRHHRASDQLAHGVRGARACWELRFRIGKPPDGRLVQAWKPPLPKWRRSPSTRTLGTRCCCIS